VQDSLCISAFARWTLHGAVCTHVRLDAQRTKHVGIALGDPCGVDMLLVVTGCWAIGQAEPTKDGVHTLRTCRARRSTGGRRSDGRTRWMDAECGRMGGWQRIRSNGFDSMGGSFPADGPALLCVHVDCGVPWRVSTFPRRAGQLSAATEPEEAGAEAAEGKAEEASIGKGGTADQEFQLPSQCCC